MLSPINNQVEDLKTYKVTRTVYEVTFETTVLAENESDASSAVFTELNSEVREWSQSFEWNEEVKEVAK